MSRFWVPSVTSSSAITAQEFWNAVELYHSRPHLVNRKLLAASQVLYCYVNLPNRNTHQIRDLFTRSAILYEMRKLKPISKKDITLQFVKDIVECHHKDVEITTVNEKDFKETQTSSGLYVSVRILIPRNKVSEACIEIVFLNKCINSATFTAVCEFNKSPCAPSFPYEIELNQNCNLRINLNSFEDADTASAQWLADNLFTKLLKWSKQEQEVCIKTLSLIPVDDYSLTYTNLKERYSEDLIRKWPSKTTTNPQKYVFEDLAIASYLICLWKTYNQLDVNFVDCGCGNGLLVYLLNREGYKGYGIDVRKRPIWEIYPPEILLKVDTITPEFRFSKSSWIIGNHSDELTPWIPVMALKSSTTTNYFVLPCCSSDFSGQKYVRENTSLSQYADYMHYIEKISSKCGFHTKIDKLRIPSTKKICLIGFATSSELRKTTLNEIDEFIEKRSTKSFVARSSIEQVRNCTQLEKHLIQKIVQDIVQLLLQKPNYLKRNSVADWNRGTSLAISSVCENLNKEDLKRLKNECGGVQTVLRNHRYLFEVDKGAVQLRLPYHYKDVGDKYRSKPCWYFRNHKDGCFLTSKDCAYMH